MRNDVHQFRLSDTFVWFWAGGLVFAALIDSRSRWLAVLVSVTAVWGAVKLLMIDPPALPDDGSPGAERAAGWRAVRIVFVTAGIVWMMAMTIIALSTHRY